MTKAQMVASRITEEVAALLVAKAWAQAERERVDKIQRKVLRDNPFHGTKEGEKIRITEPRESWLMDDVSSAKYFATMNGIHESEGFDKAKEGYCPALTAETKQTEAEWTLIKAAQEFFPEVNNDALLSSGGCEMRTKYIDLLIGLAFSASKEQVPA